MAHLSVRCPTLRPFSCACVCVRVCVCVCVCVCVGDMNMEDTLAGILPLYVSEQSSRDWQRPRRRQQYIYFEASLLPAC